eukprot:4531334-Pyramimonas_sp.AAC.1
MHWLPHVEDAELVSIAALSPLNASLNIWSLPVMYTQHQAVLPAGSKPCAITPTASVAAA